MQCVEWALSLYMPLHPHRPQDSNCKQDVIFNHFQGGIISRLHLRILTPNLLIMATIGTKLGAMHSLWREIANSLQVLQQHPPFLNVVSCTKSLQYHPRRIRFNILVLKHIVTY